MTLEDQKQSKFNIGIATMERINNLLNEMVDARLQRPSLFAYNREKELIGSLYEELYTEMEPDEIQLFEHIETTIINFCKTLSARGFIQIDKDKLHKKIRDAELLLRKVAKRKGLLMPEKKDIDDILMEDY